MISDSPDKRPAPARISYGQEPLSLLELVIAGNHTTVAGRNEGEVFA